MGSGLDEEAEVVGAEEEENLPPVQHNIRHGRHLGGTEVEGAGAK